MTRRTERFASRASVALGLALLLGYAVPLLAPPATRYGDPDSFWGRVFPGVPPVWVLARLAALGLGAVLVARSVVGRAATREAPSVPASRPFPTAAALCLAVGHALAAPWAHRLGPVGQLAYLVALAAPAAMLSLGARGRTGRPRPTGNRTPLVVSGVLVAVWVAGRLHNDIHSPRAADVVDTWRVLVDIARFVQGGNPLTDGLDPDMPGVPATSLFFQGISLFQLGLVPIGFAWIQVLHVAWISLSACAVALVAASLLGRATMPIAVAVFLFSPYTRFIPLTAGPYVVGPVYGSLLALTAALAVRRGSDAALAGFGAVAGVAIAYPGSAPTVVALAALIAWALRGRLRARWRGGVAAVASFVAGAIPTLQLGSLVTGAMGDHLRTQGRFTILEAVAMGQLSLLDGVDRAATPMVRHPVEIVVGALLSPFVNGRIPLRLWGDALFDPIGGALIAVGVVACLGSARRDDAARWILVLLAAALAPALVSNVERPNLTRALLLPVAGALTAAAGFSTLHARCASRTRAPLAAGLAVAIVGGGIALFDVVNPRILGASAMGLVLRATVREDAARSVVLSHPRALSRDAFWLFVGPMSRFAGPEPFGYLEFTPADLPDLPGEGRPIVFWSPGLEADLQVRRTLCARWPLATLFEIEDPPGLGRALAANLGATPWRPHDAGSRWRTFGCPQDAPAS